MQRWFLALGLVGFMAGTATAQVQVQAQVQIQPIGKRVPPPMQAQHPRLMQADAIFVGKVVAIEPMDVEAPPAAGQPNVKYRIAVVKISDSIYGLKKDAETVRVAFQTQGNVGGGAGGVQAQPAIQIAGPALRRPFQFQGQINLTMGQEGLFAVNKHFKEDFYLSPNFANFISRDNNPAFEGEVKTAKQLGKVLGNPAAALKSDDKETRYLGAAVLISKYRNVSTPGMATKQEPIDAEESKLILKAISGGDWTPGRFNGTIPTPFELFQQLGINQKDGYNPMNVRTQADMGQAMQKWLDENNGKYRVSKLVLDPDAKAPQPGVQPGNPGIGQPGNPGVVPPGRPGVRPLPPQALPAPNQVQPAPAPAPLPPAAPVPPSDK